MKTHLRRGKVVVVPEKWTECIASRKTIRDRKSARIVIRTKKKSRLRVDSVFHWASQLGEM